MTAVSFIFGLCAVRKYPMWYRTVMELQD